MYYSLFDYIKDIFHLEHFDDYCHADLAIDNKELNVLNMKTAHDTFDDRNLQLLYNQYLVRWFFGLPQLTPFIWGKQTPYNSIDFSEAFLHDVHDKYSYGEVVAYPHNVLYTNIDYYYSREAFRLLYNYMTDTSTVLAHYTRYVSCDPMKIKDTLPNHVRDLRVHFFERLIPAVSVGWYDVVASRQAKLSDADKAYLDALHNLAERKDTLYVTDLLYEFSQIFRLTEGIINEQ